MKRSYVLVVTVIVLVLLSSASEAIAQGPTPFQPSSAQAGASAQTALGTAFTYQGQLKNNGVPVNATCDFLFGLYDAPTGGNQFGSAVGSPNPTTVTNGLFTVQIDFGADKLIGDARWLLITVRCPAGTGNFTILDPRQPLTPAPYALALPGLYTQQNTSSPNLIGGYSGNSTNSGVLGAAISGGGASTYINRVTDNFGTVGGGRGNQAGDNAGTTVDKTDATVGGGYNNTASGYISTVGGGYSNMASGNFSVVPGGIYNTAVGYSSFAAGRRAKANWDGSFVWGDATDADFASTAPNQFLIRASGNVGIGTNSPNATVHISGTNSTLRIQSTATNVWPRMMYQTDVRQWDTGVGGSAVTNDLNGKYYVFDATAGQTRMAIDTSGNVGIGVTAPNQKMVVNGGAFTRLAIDSSANGNAGIQLRQGGTSQWAVATAGTDGDFTIYEDDAAVNRLYIKGAGANQGNVGIGTTNPAAKLDVAGTMASNVVQIRGGSDLAEKFDVSNTGVIEPGTLMVIDENNPGKLKPSDQPYDTKVAGIASGAGGVQPGLTLQQQGVMEGNTVVAIAGRVYVKADATTSPIKPGDLLTTSRIPGHAMKATDRARAQGAIIGKAMSELKEGTGLVLVLVNLQ